MNNSVRIWEDQVLSPAEVELTDAQLETIFGAGSYDESEDSDDPERSERPERHSDESELFEGLQPHCKIEETKTFTGAIKIKFDHFKVKKDWALKSSFR